MRSEQKSRCPNAKTLVDHPDQVYPRPRTDSEGILETCESSGTWVVYIVCCSDDSLYTGITTDLQRRLIEHNGLGVGKRSRGAAYTRARRPVTLAYREEHPNRSAASQREWRIKRMSREAKLKLVDKAKTRANESSNSKQPNDTGHRQRLCDTDT